ncbi:hypothetical protein B2A_03284 [mine drainage metagenome]|uniref:Transposase n=1 Tax=mine drainage metagenome TaxID=410659 RepID=T1AY57_9ZZZZ
MARWGELLRREKLYSSQLAQWRRELAEGGAERLGKRAPGPASARTPAQREHERLTRKLEMANDCLALQKKPCRCWIARAAGVFSNSEMSLK